MANAPESFEALYEQHQAFISDAPVNKEALNDSLIKLETVGMARFGRSQKYNHEFAKAMHRAYCQPATLEVVPPLSDTDRAVNVGKVVTYALLVKATAPKSPRN